MNSLDLHENKNTDEMAECVLSECEGWILLRNNNNCGIIDWDEFIYTWPLLWIIYAKVISPSAYESIDLPQSSPRKQVVSFQLPEV